LTHWLVVAVIVLLLFGRGKISELMGDMAKGIKSFKQGLAEDDDKPAPPVQSATIDHRPAQPVPPAPVQPAPVQPVPVQPAPLAQPAPIVEPVEKPN
jgi:sec-independent protein translocase protein TatA